MTFTKEEILRAAKDDDHLGILVTMLNEHCAAKQLLRDKGYGWLGLNLVETCQLVPENG
jgi:hypothetical protein